MSRSDEYYTPDYVTEDLGPFDLDPCAGPNKRHAEINYRLRNGHDGLKLEWTGFVWLNPPFSNKGAWIERMKQHGNGILLLPDRTSAPWFADLVDHCGYVFLLGKKISFENANSTNPDGTALFPFGFDAVRRLRRCALPGMLLESINVRRRA